MSSLYPPLVIHVCSAAVVVALVLFAIGRLLYLRLSRNWLILIWFRFVEILRSTGLGAWASGGNSGRYNRAGRCSKLIAVNFSSSGAHWALRRFVGVPGSMAL